MLWLHPDEASGLGVKDGSRVFVQRRGRNINAVLTSDHATKDVLTSASHLDGVPVTLEPPL